MVRVLSENNNSPSRIRNSMLRASCRNHSSKHPMKPTFPRKALQAVIAMQDQSYTAASTYGFRPIRSAIQSRHRSLQPIARARVQSLKIQGCRSPGAFLFRLVRYPHPEFWSGRPRRVGTNTDHRNKFNRCFPVRSICVRSSLPDHLAESMSLAGSI